MPTSVDKIPSMDGIEGGEDLCEIGLEDSARKHIRRLCDNVRTDARSSRRD